MIENDGLKLMVRGLYESENPEKAKRLTEDVVNNIISTYGGDYKQIVQNLYANENPEKGKRLNDSIYSNIANSYGLGAAIQPITTGPGIETQPLTYMQKELRQKFPENYTNNSVVAKSAPPEQPKEEQGFWGKLGGTVGNEFMTGMNQLNSWAADAPGFIYDLAGAPFRAVGLNVPTSKDFQDTPLSNISDYYKNSSKAYEEKVKAINPSRDKGIVGAFEQGDIKGGFLNLAGSIAESTPSSIAMMLAGGATMPTILGGAAIFGSGKAQEIDENSPEMNYDKGRIVAAINGTFEGVFETYLGSGAVAKSLAGIIKNEGKDIAKQQIKSSFREGINKMLTENPWLAPFGEGFEEVGTQIAQNTVDKYSGYKPDLNIMDGVGDSFLAGFGMGGIHGAVIGLAQKAMGEQQSGSEQPTTDSGPQLTVNPDVERQALIQQETDYLDAIAHESGHIVELTDMKGNIMYAKSGDLNDNDKIITVAKEGPSQNGKPSFEIEVFPKTMIKDWAVFSKDYLLNKRIANVDEVLNKKTNNQDFKEGDQIKYKDSIYLITDDFGDSYGLFNKDTGDVLSVPKTEAIQKADQQQEIQAAGTAEPKERKVIPQKIGNTTIDFAEGDGFHEVIPSEKMPLEKALPILEKKFKDNPKYQVLVDKAEVENKTTGETIFDDDIVEKKVVIKSIKIIPKQTANASNTSATQSNPDVVAATQPAAVSEQGSTLGTEELAVPVQPELTDKQKAYQLITGKAQLDDTDVKQAELIPGEIALKAINGQMVDGELEAYRNLLQKDISGNNLTQPAKNVSINKKVITDYQTVENLDNQGSLQKEKLQDEKPLESNPVRSDESRQVTTQREDTPQAQQGQVEQKGLEEIVNQKISDQPSVETATKPEVSVSANVSTDQPVVESLTADPVAEQIAQQEVNLNPTEAQKEAGNYKKAHISVQGMDITIENPKGSVRKGVDEEGKAWENVLQSHYGYFKRTIGKDNDHIDTFIGDNPESQMIFVVDQNHPKTGAFDESKVMTGFNTVDEAKAAYLANYAPNWKGFGSITPVPVEQFKKWLNDGAKQHKPFSEYKSTPDAVEVAELTEEQKLRQSLNQIQDEFGVPARGLVKQYIDRMGIENLNIERMIETARKVLEVDKRGNNNEFENAAAISEAIQYETGYPDNFTDLRSVVKRGGYERNKVNIDRMLQVGVKVPKDILAMENKVVPQLENKETNKPLLEELSDGTKAVEEKKQSTPLPEEGEKKAESLTEKIQRQSAEANLKEIQDKGSIRVSDPMTVAEKIKKFTGVDVVASEEFGTVNLAENKSILNKEGKIAKDESKPEKITDFGEVISGAKKDRFKEMAKMAKDATVENLIANPLSKVFPEPDYKKLVESGELTVSQVSAMKVFREQIPSKPKKSYKIKQWAEQANMYIGLISDLASKNGFFAETEGKTFEDFMNRFIEKFPGDLRTANEMILKKKFYDYAGLDYNTTAYTIKSFYYPEGRQIGILKGNIILGRHKEESSAFEALKNLIDNTKGKAKETKFNVYQDRITKDCFIGYKAGSDVVRLKEGFATGEEARKYLNENKSSLEEQLQQLRDIPDERKASNSPRIGTDYRNGKDVTPEMFTNTFGFRGVQFGNYVENERRIQDLNEAYDALMDLANVLNIPAKAISLNGELGMAFGARGSGKYAAHYEPGQIVINITKTRGAGSMAHEWFHAVDNYFERARDNKNDFITDFAGAKVLRHGKKESDSKLRIEVLQAFSDLNKAVSSTGLYKRSRKLDTTRSKPYWGTTIEMNARAFEWYVKNRIEAQGGQSDYLANIQSEKHWDVVAQIFGGTEGSYPYPTEKEAKIISDAFDHVFDVIETKEENGNVALFRILGETGAANLDKSEEATTRFDNLKSARDMEQAGKDAKSISLATGWEKGVDGKWRYEVPDNIKPKRYVDKAKFAQAKTAYEKIRELNEAKDYDTDRERLIKTLEDFYKSVGVQYYTGDQNLHRMLRTALLENKPELLPEPAISHNIEFWQKKRVDGEALLEDVIDNEQMYTEYPFLRYVGISFKNIDSKGSYSPGSETIVISDKLKGYDDEVKSTMLHEIQHAIQYFEGFAKGGNLQSGVAELYDRINKQLNDIAREMNNLMVPGNWGKFSDPKGYELKDKYEALMQEKLNANPYDHYKRLAGEVESRNVQTRMNMTPEERRNALLQETEDVAREDQVVLMDGLGISNLESDNSTNNRSLIADLEATAKYQSDVHYMDKAEAAKFAKGKVTDVAVSEIKKVKWMGLAIDNNIIISPSVKSKIELFRTWVHEKAHIQIRREFNSFREKKLHFIEMYNRIEPEELTRVLGDNYANKPDYIQAEEYYAHLAEEYAISGDIKGENVQPEIKNHIFDIVDGFTTIKTIQDVINNYNRTTGRNSEVERNAGRKGIADQSSDRGNTVDEENGRTSGQGSARIDKSLPLLDRLSNTNSVSSSKLASKQAPNTILIDGKSRSTLNSNGKPIANSEEGIRNFWKWFDNSRVTDENGRPKVVFHGTTKDFDTFKSSKYSTAGYFAEDPNFSNRFAEGAMGYMNGSPSILPVFLSLKNPIDLTSVKDGYADINPKEFINLLPFDVDQDFKSAIYGLYGGTEQPLFSYLGEDKIINKLKSEGFDGIIFNETTPELFNEFAEDKISSGKAFIAFSPSQIKSATGNNGYFSPEDNNINFKLDDNTTPLERKLNERSELLDVAGNADEFDNLFDLANTDDNISSNELSDQENKPEQTKKLNPRKVRTNTDRFRSKLQDSTMAIKNLISKFDLQVKDFSNVYYALNQKGSRSMGRMKYFINDFFDPIGNTIAKIEKETGKSYEEITRYLLARHAPERNESFRKRGKRGEVFAGMSDEEAIKYYTQFENDVPAELTNELWSKIRKATERVSKYWVEYGRFTNESLAKITEEGWNYYVPMRGWEPIADDIDLDYEYSGKGIDYTGNERTEGRTSMADDPIAYIFQMANSAILWGENNRVKRIAYNLVNTNKSRKELFEISRVHFMKDKNGLESEVILEPSGSIEDPNGTKKPDFMVSRFDGIDNEGSISLTPIGLKSDLENENSFSTVRSVDYLKRKPLSLTKQHEVDLFINGSSFKIIFKDPAIANTINGLNLSKRVRGLADVTKFRSMVVTSLNPAFTIRNTYRDFQTAAKTVFIEKGFKTSMKFAAKYGVAAKFLASETILKSEPKTEEEIKWKKWFDEYNLNGGPTGHAYLLPLEEVKSNVKKHIKKLKRGKIGKTANYVNPVHLFEAVKMMSEYGESIARFTAYVMARERGESIPTAVNDAKEITVNFDTKGEWAPMIGSFVMFYNASTQGIRRQLNLAKNHPLRYFVANASMLAAQGYLFRLLWDLMNPDDDDKDYQEVSKYSRYNNSVIGWKDYYAVVPLPQGYRVWNALGAIMYDMQHGLTDAEDASVDIAEVFSQAVSPVNVNDMFTKEGELSIEKIMGTLFSPLQPFTDVRANEDFRDNTIYKEPFLNTDNSFARSQMYKYNVNYFIKQMTDKIFIRGGGDPSINSRYVGGTEVSSWMDWNPSKIEFVTKSYTGGPGSLLLDGANLLALQIWDETIKESGNKEYKVDGFDPSVYPILNSFLRKKYEGKYRNEYRDIVNVANNLKTEYSKRLKVDNDGNLKLFTDDQVIFMEDVLKANKRIGELIDRKDRTDDPIKKAAIEVSILSKQKDIVSRFSNYDESGKPITKK